MTAPQSPTTEALIEALEDARDAIGSLDEGALGYAHDAHNTACWPIRDELMAKIGSTLCEALSRPSPIAEPQDSDAACAFLRRCVQGRDVVLAFGHEHLGWPEPSKADDKLYDAAEALARRVLANDERIATRLEAPIAEDVLVERVRTEIINTPETADFMAGVPIEAAHQRERWPSDHDEGKTAFDWFWLIGYLAQKAAAAAVAGDTEKAMHHMISTAGALANWHAQLGGKSSVMRPGIEPPDEEWFCEPCQAVNFGIRRVCRFCKQPRAALQAIHEKKG